MLLNTVPMRVTAQPHDTRGRRSSRNVQASRVDAMEHEHVGLGEIQRASGHDQLFDNLFVLQNFLDDDTFTAMNDGERDRRPRVRGLDALPVHVGRDAGQAAHGQAGVPAGGHRSRAGTTVVRRLPAHARRPHRRTGLLGAIRRHRTGAGAAAAPTTSATETVVDLFDGAADRNPDRIALVAHGKTMTFAELRDRSRHLAGVLAGKGHRRRDVGGDRGAALARLGRRAVRNPALRRGLRAARAGPPGRADRRDRRGRAAGADHHDQRGGTADQTATCSSSTSRGRTPSR